MRGPGPAVALPGALNGLAALARPGPRVIHAFPASGVGDVPGQLALLATTATLPP